MRQITARCVLASDGLYTYTPNEEYSGTDQFTVTISDGTTTSSRTINVTVEATNDAPTLAGIQAPQGVVQFDGVNDFIQVDHHPDLNPNDGSMTIETMFYWDGDTAFDRLVGKGLESASSDGFAITTGNNKLTVEISSENAINSAAQELDISGLSVGWHHVAMVIDGSAGTV